MAKLLMQPEQYVSGGYCEGLDEKTGEGTGGVEEGEILRREYRRLFWGMD